MKNYMTADEKVRIEKQFYHPAKGDQAERYDLINEAMKRFMRTVCKNCPTSRQKALALTKMEEARMWANAAIAMNE